MGTRALLRPAAFTTQTRDFRATLRGHAQQHGAHSIQTAAMSLRKEKPAHSLLAGATAGAVEAYVVMRVKLFLRYF